MLTSITAETDSDKMGALVPAAAEMDLYVSGDKQTGLEFFKAVRFLGPNNFKLLEKFSYRKR